MKQNQKAVFKYILIFSVIINVFLLGFLFFVIKDSVSENGEFYFQGKSFWYIIGIIAAYTAANSYFLFNLVTSVSETAKTIEE